MYRQKVGFAVGTGRCGTTFLAKAFGLERNVATSHCRHENVETFHRYCSWNQLPVDDAGFISVMRAGIDADLRCSNFSFESSGYLAFSLQPLHDAFGSRFVLLVRDPVDVVVSHANKGWYSEPFIQADPGLALGSQPVSSFHHFLGRIAPRGESFQRWNAMTQVGKLAWYWTQVNRTVIRQFEQLPSDATLIQRIEDLDFAAYCKICHFFGFETGVAEEKFNRLVSRRPNARRISRTVADWDDLELAEFDSEMDGLSTELGYGESAREKRNRARERTSVNSKQRNPQSKSIVEFIRRSIGN